jgi:ATP-dependent helicase YprA (DUF1998 family)/very-short-patch-repair endonuclease
MNVFQLRDRLIADYSSYIGSFIQIRDERMRELVEMELTAGLLWPDPLIQLNPSFQAGRRVDQLVDEGVLNHECRRIFRINKDAGEGQPLRLHAHQEQALRVARSGVNYVVTTGTGSGKSLTYVLPAVDHVLRNGPGRGIQAIVVYPMNALANSQLGELKKFLGQGYPDGRGPISFERYTGQESDDDKQRIMANPPDILLTNYVMLELILTRPDERRTLVQAAQGLQFLVLDELHTYRGRQGADVAMLVRRVRDALSAHNLQCVGTSATLAGPGTLQEQQAKVAEVASLLFGTEVRPENVIGETLRRTTPERNFGDQDFVRELADRVCNPERHPPTDYQGFVHDPLSIWIESTFGIEADPQTGRLVRAEPRSITGENGAAAALANLIGADEQRCIQAIEEGLLAGYTCDPNPDTGFPVFAFRLHQFISRGETVHATVEPEPDRYLTVHGQRFVPGDRNRNLLPVVFCRECGQEYYCVYHSRDTESGREQFTPRELSQNKPGDEGDPGFLYVNTSDPWPADTEQLVTRLPDDWIEEHRGSLRVRPSRREDVPRTIRVGLDARESGDGLDCLFLPAPFRFCLHCGIAYGFRQGTDFAKLTTLGSEGRSTATSILSLSTIRALRQETTLPQRARKLLSFTDNRQDASLQAGHFNDFVEVGLLRSALFLAAQSAGPNGLGHDELTQRVFDALHLDFAHFASDPQVRFQARLDTEQSLRNVLGYRLYLDLRRGWRITSPNLEQCGLLEIVYTSLEDICGAEDLWENCLPALATAPLEVRVEVAKVLLDHMRRELAIKVDYLDRLMLERIRLQSNQRLISSWAIDEGEQLEFAARLYPRAIRPKDYGGDVFVSARGGFGQFLRRTLAGRARNTGRMSLDETATAIGQLLENLRIGGVVERVVQPQDAEDVPGYQVVAAGMRWRAGDGSRAFHDPIRVPNQPRDGARTNPFFVDFYRAVGLQLVGFEAREHTAQVPNQAREERERRFYEGELPILYCSPTMELGVDIAQLNVVNLRNVPPTPANYAQRSGRAGRSGQPALVFSYCTTGSSHDQYFFKRPHRMVSGAVSPPRLDLANEDLVRAHVQAVWLAETGLRLGTSLKDILDLSGERPTLALLPHIQYDMSAAPSRRRALEVARRVLDRIGPQLAASDWYSEGWLEEVINQVERSFDRACERWRDLYRAALGQREIQNRIIGDASRTPEDRARARKLRQEAESQLELLTQGENLIQADFYSYRYFASEGFLPGYSFPRLPLSAYIPGRQRQKGRDEFLSRPRFLAISEFGPQSIVYHEGSKYKINKVILPVGADELLTGRAKLCPQCGYLHPIAPEPGPDLCQYCQAPLRESLHQLFRLQNVSTKRREKINCDEEERVRLGYEIRTAVRFVEHGGQLSCRIASVEVGGTAIARLAYGQAATLWRINLGWKNRERKDEYGFMLDTERGYWEKNKRDPDQEPDDPLSPRRSRVIPYVEDHRNSLLLQLDGRQDNIVMASIEAALKNAIRVQYQLEENELASEPLPASTNRQLILFYESAEGGAGVLRQLVDDPNALARVAREALQLCHFDPATGQDLRRAARSREDCEAACYDCLMSYSNQRDHDFLDRQTIRDLLQQLASAQVVTAPAQLPRPEHLRQLMRLAGSQLEIRWLQWMEDLDLRLPTAAQTLVEACHTRPDFLYGNHQAAIYVDGPPHDFPERQARDLAVHESMEDYGYTVIRFAHDGDWLEKVRAYPHVFGTPAPQRPAPAVEGEEVPGLDLELFPQAWHSVLAALVTGQAVTVEPGGDVTQGGRVVGQYVAELASSGTTATLVDSRADNATAVAAALQAQGRNAIAADPTADDTLAQLRQHLGVPS